MAPAGWNIDPTTGKRLLGPRFNAWTYRTDNTLHGPVAIPLHNTVFRYTRMR
jgi:hypothetical protein